MTVSCLSPRTGLYHQSDPWQRIGDEDDGDAPDVGRAAELGREGKREPEELEREQGDAGRHPNPAAASVYTLGFGVRESHAVSGPGAGAGACSLLRRRPEHPGDDPAADPDQPGVLLQGSNELHGERYRPDGDVVQVIGPESTLAQCTAWVVVRHERDGARHGRAGRARRGVHAVAVLHIL